MTLLRDHRTARVLGVLLIIGGFGVLLVTTVLKGAGPATTVYVGGGGNGGAVAVFEGRTIQANTPIYQNDPQGLATAQRLCGTEVADQRQLAQDLLQLSISGGPGNVCIRAGETRPFNDLHLSIRVAQVGEVQARRVTDGTPIALSRVELRSINRWWQELPPFLAGVFLLVGQVLFQMGSSPAQGGPEAPKRRAIPAPSRAALVVVALLMLGTACAAAIALAPERTPPEPKVGPPVTTTLAGGSASACAASKVAITSPKDQSPPAQVDQAVQVQGTGPRLKPGHKVWVFTINPESTSLNPQPQPAQWTGCRWSSATFVGSDGDAGKQFTILAAVADPSAVKAIEAYLKNANQTNTYPGMPRLPAGAREQDRLLVKRAGTVVGPPVTTTLAGGAGG